MTLYDPSQLKRRLRAEGFEIYRTRDVDVVLAERVRDNLIMDSGVAAVPASPAGIFGIVVVVRAQATHFPGASADEVMAHTRQLAASFEDLGFQAGEALTRSMTDPGNPERVLDTSYELPLRRELPTEEELFEQLRRVLAMRRSSSDD